LQNQNLQQQQSLNNSQIAGQNYAAGLQRQAEGARRWNADKYSGVRTTDNAGISPMFGYGSGYR